MTNLIQNKNIPKYIPKYISTDRSIEAIERGIRDIKYLKKTFGVIFTRNKIKWKTKQVIIDGYNLGRFNMMYDSRRGQFYCEACWKNKKLPHQYHSDRHCPNSNYYRICMGYGPISLASNYYFYEMYHTCNIIIQNYNEDALSTCNFSDELKNVVKYCNDTTQGCECPNCDNIYLDECQSCLDEDIDEDEEW